MTQHNHGKAYKFGMVIDLDKCTGCGSAWLHVCLKTTFRLKKMRQIKKIALLG